MKKSIVFFLSGLAILLAGCGKVETTEEPTAESPRHLIVDIDVNYSGESRSVKTGWEAGDVIYVAFDHFFTEDESAETSDKVYYMTLTYDGSSWKSAISDEALKRYLLNRTSGHLAAAYWSDFEPQFRYTVTGGSPRLEVINKGACTPGFVLYDVNTDYSVANGKLTATLTFEALYNMVHFSIEGVSSYFSPQLSFKCDRFKGLIFDGFSYMETPGITTVRYQLTAAGEAIPGVARPDGTAFSAILDNQWMHQETEYAVQIIHNMATPDDELDDKIMSMTHTTTLDGKEAIKLPRITDNRWSESWLHNSGSVNGHDWVRMGDGSKWATMNILADSETDYGQWYPWERASMGPRFVWGQGWRLPTYEEWKSLAEDSHHTFENVYRNGKFMGTKVRASNTGNEIYLPANGYLDPEGDMVTGNERDPETGELQTVIIPYGFYWTSLRREYAGDGRQQAFYAFICDAWDPPVKIFELDDYYDRGWQDLDYQMLIRPIFGN